MIRVYHAPPDLWREAQCIFNDAEMVEFATLNFNNYVLVAEVNTNSLDEAWELTNTIRNYWWNNALVRAIVTETRSSCKGDILVLNGQFYVTCSIGFEEFKP